MAIKYFCDKCGDEVLHVGALETISHADETHLHNKRDWSICKRCFEKFQSFMDPRSPENAKPIVCWLNGTAITCTGWLIA